MNNILDGTERISHHDIEDCIRYQIASYVVSDSEAFFLDELIYIISRSSNIC